MTPTPTPPAQAVKPNLHDIIVSEFTAFSERNKDMAEPVKELLNRVLSRTAQAGEMLGERESELKARITALEKALEPFARISRLIRDNTAPDIQGINELADYIMLGDLRLTSTTLKGV